MNKKLCLRLLLALLLVTTCSFFSDTAAFLGIAWWPSTHRSGCALPSDFLCPQIIASRTLTHDRNFSAHRILPLVAGNFGVKDLRSLPQADHPGPHYLR